MQKIILSFLLIMGLITNIVASPQMESKIKKSTKPISHKKIKRMDRSHTKRKAVRRSFKNKKEFRHRSSRNIAKKRMQRKVQRNVQRNSRYTNGYSYPIDTYREDEYRSNRNR